MHFHLVRHHRSIDCCTRQRHRLPSTVNIYTLNGPFFLYIYIYPINTPSSLFVLRAGMSSDVESNPYVSNNDDQSGGGGMGGGGDDYAPPPSADL